MRPGAGGAGRRRRAGQPGACPPRAPGGRFPPHTLLPPLRARGPPPLPPSAEGSRVWAGPRPAGTSSGDRWLVPASGTGPSVRARRGVKEGQERQPEGRRGSVGGWCPHRALRQPLPRRLRRRQPLLRPSASPTGSGGLSVRQAAVRFVPGSPTLG